VVSQIETVAASDPPCDAWEGAFEEARMDQETYNPWSVVNLVFHHLADEGLHPVLGETGDPGSAAAELLKAMGISPVAEGNARIMQENRDLLADLRRSVLGDP
jgi:hypothetical protein